MVSLIQHILVQSYYAIKSYLKIVGESKCILYLQAIPVAGGDIDDNF